MEVICSEYKDSNPLIGLYLHVVGCEDVKMSPCTFAPNQSEPVCINEFQFCDGNRDCPSGSDETVDCAEGNTI